MILNNKNETRQDSSKILLPIKKGFEFFEINKIMKFEAVGKNTLCYLTNGEERMLIKSLKEIEVMLSKYSFYRVHRSFVVNLQHIKEYHKGRNGLLIFDDGSTVTVSQRKKKDFVNHLSLV